MEHKRNSNQIISRMERENTNFGRITCTKPQIISNLTLHWRTYRLKCAYLHCQSSANEPIVIFSQPCLNPFHDLLFDLSSKPLSAVSIIGFLSLRLSSRHFEIRSNFEVFIRKSEIFEIEAKMIFVITYMN